MALFKKPSREKGDPDMAKERLTSIDDTDVFEDELDDDSITETETDSEQEGGHMPPKRKLRPAQEEDDDEDEEEEEVRSMLHKKKLKPVQEEDDEEEEEDADEEEEIVPAKKQTHRVTAEENKAKTSSTEKGYLTTMIRRDLHTRLKIHAFKSNRSMASFIEEWILRNCPK
jgi:hypothetical protein